MIRNKQEIHAIFLDIDGTLMKEGYAFSSEPEVLPPFNAEMIKKAREFGHKVIINTGRGISFLPKKIFELELDGMICGLGAYVECEGNIIFNNHITRDELSELLDYIIANKKPCRFQGSRNICHDPERTVSDGVWEIIKTKEEFFALLGDGFVSKLTIDRELCGDYRAFLGRLFNLYAREFSGEASRHGCDKAKGMQIALDYFGIPRENSIAMGDSINDREVLAYAGTSVAMGNATDELKKICDVVTDDDVDAGVGTAIRKHLF